MKKKICNFIYNFVALSTAMTMLITGKVSTVQLAACVLVMGGMTLEELRSQRKAENKKEA